MIKIESQLKLQDLKGSVNSVFESAAPKIKALHKRWKTEDGAPVFTINGKYTARGWTEWTQGFQFGMSILQFDITEDASFLKMGRDATISKMASHVSHIGVHDHGFNNVSTYGNLLRLLNEGRLPANEWKRIFMNSLSKSLVRSKPLAGPIFRTIRVISIPLTDLIPFLRIPFARYAHSSLATNSGTA